MDNGRAKVDGGYEMPSGRYMVCLDRRDWLGRSGSIWFLAQSAPSLRVRSNGFDVVSVAFDGEVKTPIIIDTSLPQVTWLIELFGVQTWMEQVFERESWVVWWKLFEQATARPPAPRWRAGTVSHSSELLGFSGLRTLKGLQIGIYLVTTLERAVVRPFAGLSNLSLYGLPLFRTVFRLSRRLLRDYRDYAWRGIHLKLITSFYTGFAPDAGRQWQYEFGVVVDGYRGRFGWHQTQAS
jgi:hypothetical protein